MGTWGHRCASADAVAQLHSHCVRGRYLDRDEWLEYARGRVGAATQIAFAEVTTRLVGNTAIVTGRNNMAASGGLTATVEDIGNPDYIG